MTRIINDGLSKDLSAGERFKLRHPDRVKELAKKYADANRESVREAGKIWRENNKDKRKEYLERYKKENRDKFKLNVRKARLKFDYGITLDEYNSILSSQNGRCAICKSLPSINRRLCVDHNHSNKKVRGLLCDRCNKALGLLHDDISSLKSAINYLENNL